MSVDFSVILGHIIKPIYKETLLMAVLSDHEIRVLATDPKSRMIDPFVETMQGGREDLLRSFVLWI